MALSPLRKKLNLAFGAVLLGFICFALWPLVSRPFELWAFCGELRPGGSLAAIEGLVADHGFKVSPEVSGQANVYDIQSLGKFSCAIRLQGGAMTSASFVFGD